MSIPGPSRTFMDQPTRKTLTVNNLRLSYLHWSHSRSHPQAPYPQDEPSLSQNTDVQTDVPVLLLHGLADHAGVWQSLGQTLAVHHSVAAPDLRGHGRSDKPQQGYDCDSIIDDLTVLMNDLGWPSAHIVGHSWSAKIACIWATRHPERFNRLVLIDPAFTGKFPQWTRFSFPFFYRVLPFLKLMGPFDSYDEAEHQAKTLKQYRDWSPMQEAVFKSSMEQKADARWGSRFCVAARDGVFDDFTRVAALTDLIHTPTLLVHPDRGLNRFAFQLKPYERFIPNLQRRSVEGNHWAFLVNPEPINAMVSEFLLS